MTPPDLDRTFALFLDVDGTLVEIAATPEAVIVAPGLPTLLAELDRQLDGAVAIVSGRPLSQIDELLHPFTGSAAGEHGVAIRYGDGTLEEMPVIDRIVANWYTSTHPQSHFKHRLTVARATPTGRISILNDELTIRTGARSEKQRIESPEHLLRLLDEHFGISLTEAPRYIWA